MGFNDNLDGFAPNMPCVKDCPNRNAYCRVGCDKYKEWQIAQKHYSNKVKWLKKQSGYGIKWNALKR